MEYNDVHSSSSRASTPPRRPGYRAGGVPALPQQSRKKRETEKNAPLPSSSTVGGKRKDVLAPDVIPKKSRPSLLKRLPPREDSSSPVGDIISERWKHSAAAVTAAAGKGKAKDPLDVISSTRAARPTAQKSKLKQLSQDTREDGTRGDLGRMKGSAFDKVRATLRQAPTTPERPPRSSPSSSPDPIDSLDGGSDDDDEDEDEILFRPTVLGSRQDNVDRPRKAAVDLTHDSSVKTPTKAKKTLSRTQSVVSLATDDDVTPKAEDRWRSTKITKKFDQTKAERDRLKAETKHHDQKAARKRGDPVPKHKNEKAPTGNEYFQTLSLKLPEDKQKALDEDKEEKDQQDRRLDYESKQKVEEMRKMGKAVSADANSFFSAIGPSLSQESRTERRKAKEEERITAKLKEATSYRFEGDETYRTPTKPANAFCDTRNLCPYCSEPMPKNPSPDLVDLRSHLEDTVAGRPEWHQTIDFCGLHRAEATTIPLGLEAGYPPKIEFEKLDRRLETGFVRSRLRRVLHKPHLSKFFRRAAREIEDMGIAAWRDVSYQSSDKVLSVSSPGYYGEVGGAIMIQHFQHLVKWGHLPSLQTTAVHPLSVSDFIITVLVPEAAVLLIMEDEGWTGEQCRGDSWDKARTAAMELRTASAQFGRWRYREKGIEGKQVLRQLERGAARKRERLEAEREAEEQTFLRRIDDDKQSARCAVDAETIVIVSTDTPDPSDYGEDDGWTEEAMAVAARVESSTKSTRLTESRRHHGRSSTSSFGDWDDDFAMAAVKFDTSSHQV